jgi:decaprenyl-phosphate phosphoribosyltransferase
MQPRVESEPDGAADFPHAPLRRSEIPISSTEALAGIEAIASAGGRAELGTRALPTARAPDRVRPRPSATVLLRACRPRQWSKNLLVLAAPCAAGVVALPGVTAEVALAFAVFCLLSSATYLINDVRDCEQDRRHPRKRMRPVAAGELSPGAAVWAAGVMGLAGVATAMAMRPAFGAVACGYLALTASYSLWWRRVVVVDIVAIAAGFVLRAVAGGAATDVHLSRAFILVTSFCAIFVVAGKRYAELCGAAGPSSTRTTLRRYSARSLRLLLAAAAAAACVAYAVWAYTRPEHGLWYGLSMAPFALWLARYRVLLGSGAGQAPEELILGDRALLALSVAWAALFLAGVYVGS